MVTEIHAQYKETDGTCKPVRRFEIYSGTTSFVLYHIIKVCNILKKKIYLKINFSIISITHFSNKHIVFHILYVYLIIFLYLMLIVAYIEPEVEGKLLTPFRIFKLISLINV